MAYSGTIISLKADFTTAKLDDRGNKIPLSHMDSKYLLNTILYQVKILFQREQKIDVSRDGECFHIITKVWS